MKFKVSPEIFEKYPNLIEAIVILKNIDNTVDGKEIIEILRNEEEKKKNTLSTIQLSSHPAIQPWRDAFKSFGSKPNKFSSSVEALLKRVVKGNELPDINPLVNLYNYCSVKHILPFGGEDFSGVYGNMELKHCAGDEEFIPIMSKENEPPDKGEVSWLDDQGVTCRKWNWRQCDRTKVTEKTKEGYFIIDGIPPAKKEDINEAAEDFIKLAKKYLNARGEIYWLDRKNPEVEVNIKTKVAESSQLPATNLRKEMIKTQKINKSTKDFYKKNPLEDMVDESLVKYKVRDLVWEAIKKAKYGKYLKKEDIKVEHPQNEEFGDFSTNVAMVLAGKLKKKPNFVADVIQEHIPSRNVIQHVSLKEAFINFHLNPKWLANEINKILKEKDTYGDSLKSREFKLIVEFGQPNTHKMPHIGHLFSYMYGESIARLTKAMGLEIFRANYQGDVGPHVAKCIWAFMKNKPGIPKTLREKAGLLQKMYQEGATAYKEDEKAKEDIDRINKMIYLKDKKIDAIYKETRQWSVDFYEEFEKSIGVHYDRYYFESEVAELGEKIVKDNIGKVFKESKGAVIFEGSKFGLHDRVFITKRGTPTYEAKDMGLQTIKYKEWPFDYMMIFTAHEQSEYFKVVIKALEELNPVFQDRIRHYGFGMVNLKSGKMSSRTGNIITGIGLVEQAIEAVKKLIKDKNDLSEKEKEKIAEKVAIAAIKYSFLKNNPFQDSVFDFEESINFEGNSGPYLQYTYARAKSILKEIEQSTIYNLPSSPAGGQSSKDFNTEELLILRTLYKFPEVVFESGMNLAPNLLCSYLFDLAQKFNLFYKKHKVLKAKNEERKARLAITAATAQVIKNGLGLLGIEALEKM
ncbi:arginine--tRNA ligase [Candidatus Dojkabacteria bacterium]|nr:arginine--tRNA ligase [Candidatus Dojkabacteria bacterium]